MLIVDLGQEEDNDQRSTIDEGDSRSRISHERTRTQEKIKWQQILEDFAADDHQNRENPRLDRVVLRRSDYASHKIRNEGNSSKNIEKT